ncbi:MAG: carbamoyltransferase HypF [Pirellulaceae bacterium]|nr:carbamoyltransferase HypF [Pirellulaceae bacterium]
MSFDSQPATGEKSYQAYRIELRGRVQGIGYRPELARLAASLNLSGSVANTSSGITVEIAGAGNAADRFVNQCGQVCPAEGFVEQQLVEPLAELLGPGFRIIDASNSGPLVTPVPLDRVVCAECLNEFREKTDRRFGYPLIGCSRCGPRYSILDAMPYERHKTAMSGFALCPACSREYQNPDDRRYHAQTTCCVVCGPQAVGLEAAISALRENRVIAIKGIGGFQLLAPANSQVALEQLRSIKQRRAKPFAIMVENLDQAATLGHLCEVALDQLTCWAGPIVIVPQRTRVTLPAELINPGLSSLGLMLPTTALHAGLVQAIGPLVVTSGNLEGDQLYYQEADLPPGLKQSVPIVVGHNRPIHRPVDDSVVRVIAGRAATIRAARGLAPLSLELGTLAQGKHVLAVGGEQKVAVALCNGAQSILGPHLGDMNSAGARERFCEQVDQLLQLYDCRPTVVVHDAHPDFFTSRWAQQYASEKNLSVVGIQHHVAHAASSLIEPDWLGRDVATVTWDGTGLGEDHTIWGGEGFVYRRATYQRVCRLKPFLLPGGDAAIRQPWRIASGLMHGLHKSDPNFRFRIPQPHSLVQVLNSQIHCSTTSSMGRLFDAAAVLIMGAILPGWEVDHEGQFAALLEAHADPAEELTYELPLESTQTANAEPSFDIGDPSLPMEWNWEPLIREIVTDRLNDVPSPIMAMRFHRALAIAIVAFAKRVGLKSLSLSGGVFQNRLLVELVNDQLRDGPIQVALPGRVPVNDGGLAAGQLVVALQQTSEGRSGIAMV